MRTAAAGATEEDLERDLRFLRRLWAQVHARVAGAKAPVLVHAEADLSLRVIRDLLARNVDRVLVDSERQYRRILGLGAHHPARVCRPHRALLRAPRRCSRRTASTPPSARP